MSKKVVLNIGLLSIDSYDIEYTDGFDTTEYASNEMDAMFWNPEAYQDALDDCATPKSIGDIVLGKEGLGTLICTDEEIASGECEAGDTWTMNIFMTGLTQIKNIVLTITVDILPMIYETFKAAVLNIDLPDIGINGDTTLGSALQDAWEEKDIKLVLAPIGIALNEWSDKLYSNIFD